MKKFLVCDCETDGLQFIASKIHVFSWTWNGTDLQSSRDHFEITSVLKSADYVICHNVIQFDSIIFERLLGLKLPYTKFIDTLALSWYLYPNRPKHGLAYIGELHGVKKPEINDWEGLSYEEYKHRCEEDVKINWLEWVAQRGRLHSIYYYETDKAEKMFKLCGYLSFKMDCMKQQLYNPLKIDVKKAQGNFTFIEGVYEEKCSQLKQVMPEVVDKSRNRNNPRDKFYKKDGEISARGIAWLTTVEDNFEKDPSISKEDYMLMDTLPAVWKEPNPGSSDQVKSWLFSLGWEPCSFKYIKEDDGSERQVPQILVDGLTNPLKPLTPSVMRLAERHQAITVLDGMSQAKHRMGVLKAFLETVDETDHVAAEIQGFTNTLRFKHRKPVCNLPKVSAPYGEMIREVVVKESEEHLFWGSDVCSLEDMTKRHYMKPLDPGYVTSMDVEGFDPHLDLAQFAKAVSQEDIDAYNAGDKPELKAVRHNYKQANYSCVYGVGAAKLARTLGIPAETARGIIEAYWERNWAVKAVADELFVRHLSDGSMWLRNPVSGLMYSLRYAKDKWSTVNQSTGVYVFDSWVLECRKRGVKIGLQYHDEQAGSILKKDKEQHEKILHESMQEVNKKLKLNVQVTVDVQFGSDYAEVH